MLDVERGMWPCGTGIFLPQMPQIDTETMQGAFIKKHGLHRCARMGLFTDSLLLLRCLPLGFDAPSAQRIATDFSHAENLSMRARFNGYAPGAEVHSPGQAKRRPGYNVLCSLRPVRAKVLKHSVLCLLLPLQGVV